MAKSLEETADALLWRPLARPLASLFSRTPATPNFVTFLGASAAVSAGVGVSGAGRWPLVGAVLMATMMVLDCTDGELARIRGGGSWRGRMIDGWADTLGTVALHAGMCVHLGRNDLAFLGTPIPSWIYWVIAAVAGYSLTWNAGILDAIKADLSPNAVDHSMEELRDDVKGPLDRLLYLTFESYVKRGRTMAKKIGATDDELFWRVQRVGPTAHNLWMAGFAIAAVFWPSAYLGYFFVAIVPANLYLLNILRTNRKLSGVGSK